MKILNIVRKFFFIFTMMYLLYYKVGNERMWIAVNYKHFCISAFIDHLLCAHHYWQKF